MSNFNLQPVLENNLILLRPLRKDDFKALYEVANDPLIWEQHPCHDRYKLAVFAEFFKDSLESNGTLIIIDKSSKEIIGSTRFKRIEGVDNAIEIGWSFLARAYCGGIYNKAMKTLLMNHAFEFVENVIFFIDKNNIRSQKAIMKLGGKRELSIGRTDWTYRIKKEEWKLGSDSSI